MDKLELVGQSVEFRASHILYFDVTADDIELETKGNYVLLKIRFTRLLTWYVTAMFIPTLTMIIASEGEHREQH